MSDFKNRTVFITGASAGIGASLAREFAGQKANLIITARRQERLDSMASELRGKGHRVLPVQCDVTKEEDLNHAVALGIQEFGKIDVVIANAGFGVAGAMSK